MDYIPTTWLEAVNVVLSTIGEQAVTEATIDNVPEATIAATMLHNASRAIQTRGLHCNSEENYPLAVDGDNYLTLPLNTLKVDASDRYMDVVRRGVKLYDKYKHTFDFSTITELKVDIVFFLEFTDLPEVVREYITIKAARKFQKDILGSEAIDAFTQEDEYVAYTELQRAEMDNRDDSLFDAPDLAAVSAYRRR